MQYDDFMLLRKGWMDKLKAEYSVTRFQTALICESLIGGGKGRDYVMKSWPIHEGEGDTRMTADDVKAIVKKKMERDALKRLKNG